MATELGNFLHTRRIKMPRSQLNLPYKSNIATLGARREEVAVLAGISADYYARIEQGRVLRPSMRVLDSLAEVLCLDDIERRHLYRLAEIGYKPSYSTSDREDICRPGLENIIRNLTVPAYIVNARNDILAANPATYTLYLGLDEWPEKQQNTTRYVFLHPNAPSLFTYWDEIAENSAAYLRNQLSARPDDRRLIAFIDELKNHSVAFRKLWQKRDVYAMTQGIKSFTHPYIGEFTLEYEVLQIENSQQRMLVFQTEPQSPHYEALHLLSTLSLQKS